MTVPSPPHPACNKAGIACVGQTRAPHRAAKHGSPWTSPPVQPQGPATHRRIIIAIEVSFSGCVSLNATFLPFLTENKNINIRCQVFS